jgi:hypothetical protein
MTDQIEKLKQLAADAARDAALPMPPDYRIHRIGKEIRARLKVAFPATDFFIATSDGFDTMYGEFSPMVELRWNDGPSRNVLRETLHDFIGSVVRISTSRHSPRTASRAARVVGRILARSRTSPPHARAPATVSINGERAFQGEDT